MAGEDIDQLIQLFVSVTGASPENASKFLEKNNLDLTAAIDDYYVESANVSNPEPTPQASSSRSTRVPNPIRSFADLNRSDDESSPDDDANFFTGGEKSALQVENPDKKKPRDLVRDLLKKAQETAEQPDTRAQPAPRKFTGSGFRLGSDANSPSALIPDPTSHVKKMERVTREITFWKDGFQVGDGPLYRYDDPANASYLSDLNNGRAPLSLLNVKFGQEVDVNVTKKVDEEYTPPKRKIGGYQGSGHRLGSPVPGEVFPEPEVEAPKEPAKKIEPQTVKPSGEGDITIQFRLANGERKLQKFNKSDTVASVYGFVQSLTHDSRSFVLSHAFPVKPITKDETSIVEAGLANATVVQRWS